MAEFTDLMRDVLQALTERKSPAQIRAELGLSPQRLANNLRKLVDQGYIVRASSHTRGPWKSYPYEVVKPAPIPAPRLPTGARFRSEYAVTNQRDLSVEPITLARWGRWSVQGAPLLHPEGKHPTQLQSPYRVLVVYRDSGDPGTAPGVWSVVWPRGQVWSWRDTAGVLGGTVPVDQRPALTLLCAGVLGVDAVLEPPS